MKKTIIIMGVLILFTASAFTSDFTGAGVKVGLNMSSINDDDIDIIVGTGFDTKTRMGFTGGGFAEYSFIPEFSMEAEVLLSMKGSKMENEAGDEYELKLTYIEIPILVKLNFPMEGKLSPNFYAGPALGFLLSAKGPYPNEEDEEVIEEDVDIKDYMNTIDYGVVMGVGFEYQMDNGSILFDLRYNLGLSKIGDGEPLDLQTDPDWKNNSISFMVGYSFF